MPSVEDFKIGDIVRAGWKNIALRSKVGVVVGHHPEPWHYAYETTEDDDRMVMVQFPGFAAGRAFRPAHPDDICRHATQVEIQQYFADQLKYGK